MADTEATQADEGTAATTTATMAGVRTVTETGARTATVDGATTMTAGDSTTSTGGLAGTAPETTETMRTGGAASASAITRSPSSRASRRPIVAQ